MPNNGTDSQIRTPQGLGTIQAQRFPHLGEAVFDHLGNQTLATCKKVSRHWCNHLDQQKIFNIRIILSYIEKFHKVGDEWNRFLRDSNTEMVNRLGVAFKTSLMSNGRKKLSPITEVFKEFMAENSTKLASLASTFKGPITQEIFNTAIAEITLERDNGNIPRWGFWTQTQAFLMELADKLPRVIIMGGNGTGKTAMLEAFAARQANEHPKENVTFAIQQVHSHTRPLLQLDLEVQYENLKNVTVTKFTEINQLNHASTTNTTICIDEITMFNVRPEDLHNIKSKNLWVVIRDTWNENPEEYLRNEFPGWVLVNLNNPLRTSKRISEKVKTGTVHSYLHKNNFNASLDVAANMLIGQEPMILPSTGGSYQKRLHYVFSAVGKDKPALIILDHWSMNPTSEEIQEARKTTSHKDLAEKTDNFSPRILVAMEAVKACKRPPPLLWFKSNYASVSDGKEDIKEWMRGKNKTYSARDLITDEYCVAGYEADLVIYLGSSSSMSTYMPKCRGQFVQVPCYSTSFVVQV